VIDGRVHHLARLEDAGHAGQVEQSRSEVERTHVYTHKHTRARASVVWETFSISTATTENTHQHASYALNEFGMMMQNMSQVRRPLQNSILKIQDG